MLDPKTPPIDFFLCNRVSMLKKNEDFLGERSGQFLSMKTNIHNVIGILLVY